MKISLNGAEFYYELHGRGQPLILITGYNADTTIWLSVLDKLSEFYQVLIFDNRGSGKTTDDLTSLLNIESMADDAIALIRELGLHQPHVLGLSMGGSIAQYLAGKYGNEISRLVLMCTSAKWRQAALQGLELFIKLNEQNVDLPTIINGIMPWCFGEKFLTDSVAMELVLNNMITNSANPLIINQKRQFNALSGFDGREIIKSIKAPTLVIAGREDLLSLPYEAEYLTRNITNARITLFDCAHVPHIEVKDQFMNELTNFLN